MRIMPTFDVGSEHVIETNAPLLAEAPAFDPDALYDIGDMVIENGEAYYEALKRVGGFKALELAYDLPDFYIPISDNQDFAFSKKDAAKNGDLFFRLYDYVNDVHYSFANEFSDWTLSEQDGTIFDVVAMTPDGSMAAYAFHTESPSSRFIIRFVDVATETTIKDFEFGVDVPKYPDRIMQLSISPDGNFFSYGYDSYFGASGTEVVRLSDFTVEFTKENAGGLFWSLDSAYFFINHRTEGADSTGLEVYPVTTFAMTDVFNPPATDGGSSGIRDWVWSDDGSKLIVRAFDYTPNIDRILILSFSSGVFSLLASADIDPDAAGAETDSSYSQEGIEIIDRLIIAKVRSLDGVFAYVFDFDESSGGLTFQSRVISGLPGHKKINELAESLPVKIFKRSGNAVYVLVTNIISDWELNKFYLYKTSAGGALPSTLTKDVVGIENAAWLYLGATNPFKPFDDIVGTRATGADSYSASAYNPSGESFLSRGLAWRIEPGIEIDALVLLGLEGDFLDVRVMSAGGAELFGQRIDISSRARAAVFSIGLPVDGEIRISVAKASGDASVGNILIGTAEEIGTLEREGLNISGVDYSIIVDNADATAIFERIGAIGGKKIAFVGSQAEQWALTVIYGVRERWSIKPWSATEMKLTMTVRGLV